MKATSHNRNKTQQQILTPDTHQRSVSERMGQESQVLRTMNLPANSQIELLEDMLAQMVVELENDKKQIQMLRGDLLSIGYTNNEQNGQISQYIIDETARIGRTFKKLQFESHEDDGRLHAQIKQLNQERMLIQQQTDVLAHRINENEINVGYKAAFENL